LNNKPFLLHLDTGGGNAYPRILIPSLEAGKVPSKDHKAGLNGPYEYEYVAKKQRILEQEETVKFVKNEKSYIEDDLALQIDDVPGVFFIPSILENDHFSIDCTHQRFNTDMKTLFSDRPVLKLPFTIAKSGHILFKIPGTDLNGMFDTGAMFSVFTPLYKQKHRVDFKRIKTTEGSKDAAGKPFDYKLYVYHSANRPSIMDDTDVVTTDLSKVQKLLPEMDMILGMNTIKKYDWYFDYKTHTVTYAPVMSKYGF
jgi:hypothetical protein